MSVLDDLLAADLLQVSILSWLLDTPDGPRMESQSDLCIMKSPGSLDIGVPWPGGDFELRLRGTASVDTEGRTAVVWSTNETGIEEAPGRHIGGGTVAYLGGEFTTTLEVDAVGPGAACPGPA